MTDSDIIFELVCRSALIQTNVSYKTRSVKLKESKAPDSSVTILGLPDDALIICVDAFPLFDQIFKCDHGECKRADFIIISTELKCILFIEMKSTQGNWKQIVNQLQGAQCLIRYLQEVGIAFWEKENFLKNYQPRFISVRHTTLPKKKMRIDQRRGRHDTPQKAMKINWPNNLQFRRIAGINK